MRKAKFRQLLNIFHMMSAAFLAPAFALIAITGGLHMVGGGERLIATPIALPDGAVLDFKSPELEAQLRALLSQANIDHDFEYIKNRGSKIQTRPTSRPFLEITQTTNGLSASLQRPNFQKAMMEVHKGHGPKILRHYHKLAALLLCFVIFSGLAMGLISPLHRRKTIAALLLGSGLYIALIVM